MVAKYTLYGAELSLYTGKARSYLRYKGVDWQEQPPTAEVFRDIILPVAGAPIIPVLQLEDGRCIQDTTEIIDALEALHPENSVYPTTPRQHLIALLLECYGDEWLVIPAMHYRWSVLDQQYDFIMSEFGKAHAPEATVAEQIAIGEKMSAPFRSAPALLGITEQTIAGIESAYLTLLQQLNRHFAQYNYLLGDRPSIGDFGFMGPLYAHLGRDPVPKRIMQEQAPAVYAWVQRMNAEKVRLGQWCGDDEIPDTLLPVLETLAQDYLPDVRSVMAHNRQYVQDHPGQPIPRVLGMHDFSTGGCHGQRYVHSYAQWMFQRPLRYYQQLPEPQRASCTDLLEKIGALSTMQQALDCPLQRQPGQLELVAEKCH